MKVQKQVFFKKMFLFYIKKLFYRCLARITDERIYTLSLQFNNQPGFVV